MKGSRIYTGAARKISDHWHPNCFFLKIDIEGDKTRGANKLFTNRKCTAPAPEDGLVLAVISRCTLLTPLGVGGGRRRRRRRHTSLSLLALRVLNLTHILHTHAGTLERVVAELDS